MHEVVCPKCGTPMELKTVKRGKNAVKKYYKCPRCKTTFPYYIVLRDISLTIPTTQLLEEKIFPRKLQARAKSRDYQVRFFETVATSEELLHKIIIEDLKEHPLIKAFSQWRLDFPIKDLEVFPDDKQRQIISVIEKILTRGHVTLISPKIEAEFIKTFKPEPITDIIATLRSILTIDFKKSYNQIWLDSNEENIFYQTILPQFIGKNYEQFVIPQLEIATLSPKSVDIGNRQRVDFAIFHPELEENIIVEIQGEQHKDHIETDKKRKEILERAGFSVIDISAKEVRENEGENLSLLKHKLSNLSLTSLSNTFENLSIKYLLALKIAHQLQISILQAISSGFLSINNDKPKIIITDIDKIGIFTEDEVETILKTTIEDFIELTTKIASFYSDKLNFSNFDHKLSKEGNKIDDFNNAIYISFTNESISSIPTFYIQNIYFPFHIKNSSFLSPPPTEGLNNITKENLKFFLKYLFRKDEFWEGQYEGIERILQSKDTLLLLPTGGGKSLVYQLASLLLPGRTIIIDPLISLMEDQIENLAMIGIDRTIAITSQLSDVNIRNEAINLFGQGEYLFVFIAPERFQIIEFRNSLARLKDNTPITLIVIDEAHCVSEWGHDFRTAYLNIGKISREYSSTDNYTPPLLALTGTASVAVLKDIQRELQVTDFEAIITPKTFDRPELRFIIKKSKSSEKLDVLKGLLEQQLPSLFNITPSTFFQPRGENTYSGIIFCPHVGGEFGVEEVANKISESLKINCGIYSGKEPKLWDPESYKSYKIKVARDFKRNKIPLLVTTKAFGMGIDKPNIRYTIHFGIPSSIESFYQEAGRAGRDKKISYCCIIASVDDAERASKLLDPKTPVEEIKNILETTRWEEKDDITRVLYFHTKAFRGINDEIADISKVINALGDISKKSKKIINIPDMEKNIVEKALHRLLVIGVIKDYTIDYSNDEFTVEISGAPKEEIIKSYGKYVASYHFEREPNETQKAEKFLNLPYREFITNILLLLLNFIYNVIERGRRAAFYEIVLACYASLSEQDFRKRISYTLGITEFSPILEEILKAKDGGIKKIIDLTNNLRSTNDAEALRGQVSRYLESYPDHPGLLFLRSISELFSKDKDEKVAIQHFKAATIMAIKEYNITPEVLLNGAAALISEIFTKDQKITAKRLVFTLIESLDLPYIRVLIRNLPPELRGDPAWFLLKNLNEKSKELIQKIRQGA